MAPKAVHAILDRVDPRSDWSGAPQEGKFALKIEDGGTLLNRLARPEQEDWHSRVMREGLQRIEGAKGKSSRPRPHDEFDEQAPVRGRNAGGIAIRGFQR